MAINQFGIDLYKKIAGSPDNLLISPFSIYSVLLLVYTGARGHTASQLADALHCSPELSVVLDAYRKFLDESHIGELDAEFDTANSLWVQEGYALEQPFLKMLTPLEEQLLYEVDFSSSEQVAKQVNQWVARQTRGKIQDILSPQSLSAETRLILANAAYFKSDWENPFDPEITSDEPFKALTSPTHMEIRSVAMMYQEDHFSYYGDDDLQAVELLYSARFKKPLELTEQERKILGMPDDEIETLAFSMVILLPRQDDGIFDLEKRLTADRIQQCIDAMTSQKVYLELPKFKMSCFYELPGVLQALGITDVFDPNQSDLSGITRSEPLFVSGVIHQSFINVDESGTEAAAVTMTEMLGGLEEEEREEPARFKADHPFLFLIRHIETNTILFMGRVLQPENPKEG